MTYEELKQKHYTNCYKKYSCTEMKAKYPELMYFYFRPVKVKGALLYDDVAKSKYISYSTAKKYKKEIYPDVIGFLCNHFGCYPLFELKN